MSNDERISKIRGCIHDLVFGSDAECYLVIDPTLKRYHTNNEFYALLEKYDIHKVHFPHAELEGALELWLIRLNADDPKDITLLDASAVYSLSELTPEKLKSGEGRSVCGWISTGLSVERLADYIAYTAIQNVQSVGDILIRFFDPSVFGLFSLLMDDWQKQQLINNINLWSYIDGNGQFRVISGGGETRQRLNYSLGITESVLADINNITRINKILREYREVSVSERVDEIQAAQLLYPALRYFLSNFSLSDDGYIDFGIDILTSQKLFYLNCNPESLSKKRTGKELPVYGKISPHPYG
jgi:hypothetical protein